MATTPRLGLRGRAAPLAVRCLDVTAHGLSALFCPPLVIVGLAWTAWLAWGGPLWAPLVVAAGSGLLPAAVTLALWRAGLVTDLDLSRREERLVPVLSGLGGAGLALALVWAGGAGPWWVGLEAAALVTFAVLAAVTLGIKVSIHSATMAGWLALALVLGSALAWWLLPLALATGWSRIWLQRHRPLEVGLGLVLGLTVPLLLFGLLAGLGGG